MRKQLLPLQHWKLYIDDERICWAEINQLGSSQNTLGRETGAEAQAIFQFAEKAVLKGDIIGLVIMSTKEKSFIAGADVKDFESLKTAQQVEDEIRPVVEGFDRIEQSSVPVVAAINGFCLGGGLELALACHYRIAVNDDTTRLGLPEVKLGLFPGFNGTVRMIKLTGAIAGMEAMLTGRMYKPKPARAMGLVDELVSSVPELRWAARRAILKKKRSKSLPWSKRILTSWPIRGFLASRMRKTVAAKVRREHYPSPYALVDLFAKYGGNPKRMAKEETKAFAPLLVGDTSRNLRRIFHLSEMMKAQAGDEKFTPLRAHVVGAGTMGGDIAGICVLANMEVSLQDQTAEAVEKARQRCLKLFRKRLKDPLAVDAAMKRLTTDVDGEHVNRADLVIEAVFENLKVKHEVLTKLEAKMKPDAVLATNTSSLPIEDIAAALQDPSRLIGLHFFNPVPLMPLVEVIHCKNTSAREIKRGCAVVVKLNKFPLIVKSSPGFLVNRVLAPYLFAAMKAFEAGASKEKIDAAAEAFGMFMGPVEVADNVGLDVCQHVSEVLGYKAEQGPKAAQLVADGKLGKKTGEGFYKWKNGKPVKAKAQFDKAELEEIARKLVEPLIAECQKCVAEGVVESADLADAGVIFGTGFAPFRGGPMHYSSSLNNEVKGAEHAEAAE